METIGYGGVFLSMALTMQQLYKNYRGLDSDYQRWQQSQIFTPQTLIEEIQKEISTNSDSNNIKFIRKKQVFIEGVISSNYPIKSMFIEGLDLLYSLFYQKDLYSRKEFSKNAYFPTLLPKKQIKSTKVAQDLYLKDYDTQLICQIIKQPNTNLQGKQQKIFISYMIIFQQKCIIQKAALELLQMKANFVKSSILTDLIYSTMKIMELIVAFTSKDVDDDVGKVKQYQGTLDIEIGMKMNSLVTIFGDIIYDSKNKKLIMENPLYILKDRHQLLNLIKKKLLNRKIILLIFSIPLILGGSMFFKKLVELIKKYFQSQKDKIFNHLRDKMDILAQDANVGDNQKCNICYTNIRNIILKPCLHMCLCFQCLRSIKKQECPICKANIIDYIELFLK